VNRGPYGPYVKFGEQFITIPRGEDPLEVDMDRAIELIKEKQLADAPIAHYDSKPVTKGKGRFGPYLKWEGMFINVPKRYDFDNLSKSDIDELIANKIKKEENRYIQRWPDDKISIENARWGPVVKWGKKIIKLPRKADESKYTADELKDISVDTVKEWVVAQIPNAFGKKKKEKKPAEPKAAPVKAAAKKPATKKASPKKKK
jgi:DNA topoisomerase I